jgi:hypothetical protein
LFGCELGGKWKSRMKSFANIAPFGWDIIFWVTTE